MAPAYRLAIAISTSKPADLEDPPKRRLSPSARRAFLTAHIALSVGLLGVVSADLATAIRATTTDDPGLRAAAYELMSMFSLTFGIPLSVLALLTGGTLGLGGKWGVFQYPWVTIKLLLVVSVMVVGALLIGPAVDELRKGASDAEGRMFAGAIWDLLALLTATVLSVYKPGRRWRSGSRER